jgi:hypothetical protein
MIQRAGVDANLGFKAHPHMLRHACGYALANKGHETRALQAYLGHKNIQHTVRYTELSPTRFKDFCGCSTPSMSAFPPTADIAYSEWNVCFVPKAEQVQCNKTAADCGSAAL